MDKPAKSIDSEIIENYISSIDKPEYTEEDEDILYPKIIKSVPKWRQDTEMVDIEETYEIEYKLETINGKEVVKNKKGETGVISSLIKNKPWSPRDATNGLIILSILAQNNNKVDDNFMTDELYITWIKEGETIGIIMKDGYEIIIYKEENNNFKWINI